MGKLIVAMFISAGLSLSEAKSSEACPYKTLWPTDSCSSLQAKPDSEYIPTTIIMVRTSTDPDADPAKSDSLIAWAQEMFNKYDFRAPRNTSIKVPYPGPSWFYEFLSLPKASFIQLLSERYVLRVDMTVIPATIVRAEKNPSFFGNTSEPKAFYDATGKMKSIRIPTSTLIFRIAK